MILLLFVAILATFLAGFQCGKWWERDDLAQLLRAVVYQRRWGPLHGPTLVQWIEHPESRPPVPE